MSQSNTQELPQFITIRQVIELSGFKKATIYKYIQELNFPRPVKFTNSSRWVRQEVEAWMLGKVEERDVA